MREGIQVVNRSKGVSALENLSAEYPALAIRHLGPWQGCASASDLLREIVYRCIRLGTGSFR